MDKNTIIGIVLIGLILLGFSILNRPDPKTNPPQIVADSTAIAVAEAEIDSVELAVVPPVSLDSLKATELVSAMGTLSTLAEGEDKNIRIENEKLTLVLATRGGMPIESELKDYKAQEGKPLYLFQEDDIEISLPLLTVENKMVNTSDLYFSPIAQTDSSVVMRLMIDSLSYLDFSYKLRKGDYRVDFAITGQNLDRILPANMTRQNIEWKQRIRQQELVWKNENQYSTMFYKYSANEVDDLTATKNQDKQVSEPLHWVAFKDKYFSTVLIANERDLEGSKLTTKVLAENSGYIKDCTLTSSFLFNTKPGTVADFTLYLGPNDYRLLTSYDKGVASADQLDLDHLVYLGASFFRFINKWLVIPVVDFLDGFNLNWGIIILLLTIFIKLLLSPFTFKSYKSQAKMRVLKPQVEAINAKYPGKDQETMLKKNQETMALYKTAGASPMAGCLPMLIQMPFLISLYMYFPTSILLRGESFLWAKDLSTIDPILTWSFDIPFLSSFYGNHISLFCLIWAITNVIYSKYTMGKQSTGQQQMAGMKWMPYIMTVMMLFFFNNNASGLCYYYFISTLITILQYVLSKVFLNEEKLLAKLEENKKKPAKKSKWAARLEEMQKQQREMQKQQAKRRP